MEQNTNSLYMYIKEIAQALGNFLAGNKESDGKICYQPVTISTMNVYHKNGGNMLVKHGKWMVSLLAATIMLLGSYWANAQVTASLHVVNSTCNGLCDGKVWITINSGTPPYSYTWNNGAVTDTVTNLCAGAYNVTITDSTGATVALHDTVRQPAPINISGSYTAHGLCNDTLITTVTGGTPIYTYSWIRNTTHVSNTTSYLPGVCPFEYDSLIVTDFMGCHASFGISFGGTSSILTYSMQTTNPSCYGQCNGTTHLQGLGGRAPYTYDWNVGADTSVRNNLCAGIYTITVHDVNGDSVVVHDTITQPAALTVTDTFTSHGSCTDTIFLFVGGGTLPYNYNWGTGSTGSSYLPYVCTGQAYSATITDGHGCQIIWNGIPGAGNMSGQTIGHNTLCYGSCDGWASVQMTSGVPPYTYLWNSGPPQTTDTAIGLCAGNYTVTIADAAHNTLVKSVTVGQPTAININFTYTSNGLCLDTVFSLVGGGTGPYTYSWSPGGGTSSYLPYVCSGQTNSLTVTDANGCTHTASMVLPAPTSSCYSFDDVAVPSANTQQAFNIYGNGAGGFLGDWHVPSGTPSIYRSGDITGINAYDGNQCALMAVCNSGSNNSEGLELAYNFVQGNSYRVSMAIRNAPEPGRGIGPVDMKFVLLQNTINYVYNPNTGCSATPAIPSGALVVDSLINFATNAWTVISFNITGLTQNYSQLWIRGKFNSGTSNTADILIDSMCVQQLSSDVWPGDANNDGLANNFDVLTIGQGYLHTGTTRASASLVWVAQPSADWANNIPNGQNEKFADCDGNGTIDADDTLAVTQNYLLTHLKADAQSSSNNPRIYIRFPVSYYIPAGQTINVPVFLGDPVIPVASIYGISFSVGYDTTLVKRGTAELTTNGSWIGTRGNDMLTFRKDLYDEARTDITLVRTNQNNTAGMGKICTINYVMKDDISGKDEIIKAFIPRLSRVRAILADGTIIPINFDGVPDTAWITQWTGIEPLQDWELNVYPNPANDYIMAYTGNHPVSQYVITDIVGRTLVTTKAENGMTVINTSSLAAGSYLLRAQEGKTEKVIRIIITR